MGQTELTTRAQMPLKICQILVLISQPRVADQFALQDIGPPFIGLELLLMEERSQTQERSTGVIQNNSQSEVNKFLSVGNLLSSNLEREIMLDSLAQLTTSGVEHMSFLH